MNANPFDKQVHASVMDFLGTVKKELGEDAWKAAVKKQVMQALRLGGNYEDFWKEKAKDPEFAWLDLEETRKQVAAMPAVDGPDVNTLLSQTLGKRMPGMKTQAQFNTFRAAFEAFEAVINNIFSGNAAQEAEARKILETAFTACRQATDISRKLADVPEAATSKAADEFKKAPAEFQEYDVQQKLLGELGRLQGLDELKAWYEASKPERDSVKSQTLRNVLLDSIRARKLALTPQES